MISASKPLTLPISANFHPEGVDHPFDTVEWDLRSATIKDDSGKPLFEQTGCRIPKNWSQLATNVVVSKYFYGDPSKHGGREGGVDQLVHRVARTIADWGIQDGYFTSEAGETFYRDLAWLCLHQYGAFNSPVWFNVGLHHVYGVTASPSNWVWDPESGEAVVAEDSYKSPQASACFIQSVDDNMEDIMRLAVSEAMLFKFGSGTGTDLSTIRSTREKLSGGGTPSGPLSFMKVYDSIAGVIKSGGKTRRAAKMQSLKVHHPDILEFIQCKWNEEKKAHALIREGYESNFNGEAYSSVGYQNANLSVRVDDAFMAAVQRGRKYQTKWVHPSSVGEPPEYDARDLLRQMAECAWNCGDPGIQYDTTINKWHTCPNSGPINASNPCCFVGETLVRTSEGDIEIQKLAEMAARGEELPYAFAHDRETGRHVMRRIKHAWKAGETRNLTEVKTDKGLSFRSTSDHNYLSYEGDYIEAQDLKPGQRLRKVAFSVKDHRSGRKWITLPGFKDTSVLARWMWEQVNGPIPEGYEVHHVNGDPTDDRISNFEAQGRSDHRSQHAKGAENVTYIDCPEHLLLETWEAIELTPRKTHKRSEATVTPGRWNSYVRSQGLQGVVPIAASKDGGRIQGKTWAEFAEWVEEQKCAVNDRVRSVTAITSDEPVSVYDIEVDDVHNFAITCEGSKHGIIVANSEYMFLDNTACNLASINLMKFMKGKTFDWERYKQACRIFLIAQEILVDRASYPTKEIAENSHRFRPLGLGYSNLGSVIMSLGLPYDSDEARGLCGAITSIMHASANLTSTELAAVMGPFEGYTENAEPMNLVMQMHRDAVEDIHAAAPGYLLDAARKLWDEVLALGNSHGFRNSQVTVLAPTGTISFMMDCDTTGIEPEIALVKYKQLAGGGMLKIVNQMVPRGLQALGYYEPQIGDVVKYIQEHDTIEGAPHIKEEHLPVFDCAFKAAKGDRSIRWQAHVLMMAAAQPFLSGAISKTVNMPAESSVQDIADAYFWGWELGLKAIAIYRDGSKQSQPLNTKTENKVIEVAKPIRERLPETRQSITHKFEIGGHEGYLCVGLYPDGRPGEIFITMAKEGSTIGGIMDSFGTAMSLALQHGVPLEVLVNKFSHTRFEPSGFTKNKQIRRATSVVDYIARWLKQEFLTEPTAQEEPKAPEEPDGRSQFDHFQSDAPSCDNCGNITVRNGNCYLCYNCGNSLGCS